MAENILNWLDANWFALLAGVFLTGFMLYGHNCGFLRLSISIAAVLITAVLTRLAMPYVTVWVTEHTGLESMLENMIVRNIGLEAVSGGGTPSPEEQLIVIDSMSIPEGLREWVKENNTELIWEKLGVKEFSQYVAHHHTFYPVFHPVPPDLDPAAPSDEGAGRFRKAACDPRAEPDRRRCPWSGRRPVLSLDLFHGDLQLYRDPVGEKASGADQRQRLAEIPVPVQWCGVVHEEHARRTSVVKKQYL